MNTTLSTTRPSRQQQHPPSPTPNNRAPAQRVGLIDRLALQLGVALVAWSRRPREHDSRERQARRIANARATEQREAAQQRMLLQLLSPR